LEQTPQVLPAANLMKPDSPQDFDQEFLISQAPPFNPVKVTP